MNDTRGRHTLSCLPCHPARLSAVHSWAGPNQRESDRSAENMCNTCFQQRELTPASNSHGEKRSRLGRAPHFPSAAAAGRRQSAGMCSPSRKAAGHVRESAIPRARRRGLSRQEKSRADPRVVATRNRNSELTNPSATKQRKRQRTCMGKARRLQVAVLAARGRKGGGLLDRQPVSSG